MSPVVVLAMIAPSEAPVVVHHEHGRFGEIFVVDEGDLRYLRFDWDQGDDQTVIEKGRPDRLPMKYLQGALVGFAAAKEAKRFLMIGLGGGALTSYLAVTMPTLTMEAVEIDPAVVGVAKRFFGVTEGPRLKIHVDDGARFVATTSERYDVIFLDAYSGTDLPPHLTARRFFRSLASRLTPHGVVVLNVAVDSAHVERTLLTTVAKVFPHCTRFTVEDDENTIVIAGLSKLPDLSARIAEFQPAPRIDLSKLAKNRRPCVPAAP